MVRVQLKFKEPFQLQMFLLVTHGRDIAVNHDKLTLSGSYSYADVATAIDYLQAELLELHAVPN